MSGAQIPAGGLLSGYATTHPEALAGAVARKGDAAAGHLVARLPEESQPSVIARLPQPLAASILHDHADESIVRWLPPASTNVATLIVRRVDESRRQALLTQLPARRRRELERALPIREGSVGALAEPHYDWLRHDATVADAAKILRSRPDTAVGPLLVLDGRQPCWRVRRRTGLGTRSGCASA